MPTSAESAHVDPPVHSCVNVEMLRIRGVRLRNSDVLESPAYTSCKAMETIPNHLERRTIIGPPSRESEEAVRPDLDGQEANHTARAFDRTAQRIIAISVIARRNASSTDAMESGVVSTSSWACVRGPDNEFQAIAGRLDLYPVLKPVVLRESVGVIARWRSGEFRFTHAGPGLPASKVRSRLS